MKTKAAKKLVRDDENALMPTGPADGLVVSRSLKTAEDFVVIDGDSFQSLLGCEL